MKPIIPRTLILLVALALPSLTLAQSAADEAFETLAAAYLADLPDFSPVSATSIGDHSADDRVDEMDAAARERLGALYRQYGAALDDIDRRRLSRANQVDAALLDNELRYRLWSLETLQEWAWNPRVYSDLAGSSIYSLMARDFAPVEERLKSAAARLEQLPRLYEQARASLQPARVPRVHAETAVDQNPGLNSVIDNMIVPQLDALSGADRVRLETAMETAREANAIHQTWLEEELLPRAAGDFRLGAELYDTKLGFTLDTPLSREEIRALADRAYEQIRSEMYEVSRALYAREHGDTVFPDEPDEAWKQSIIRAALEQAYQVLPARDEIVETAKRQLRTASDFVVEKDIVTLPDEPVEVIVMPEFQRGVTFAYLDPPGPLEKDLSAFYAVAPLPEDWTDEQVASFLREYNEYSMQVLTIHEGVPGHYLQIALSNRYPSTLRAVLGSGKFIEGWAVYIEGVMVEEGYLDHDPLMKLIMLKWRLRAVTNAIMDSAIHVDGMTREEAMHLMVEGGFQEEREAAGKWVRAQLTSAQLSTYFVGYQEHVDLRREMEEAWGDDFTLRRYHDQALSYGSPPHKYVRAMMLDAPIPE